MKGLRSLLDVVTVIVVLADMLVSSVTVASTEKVYDFPPCISSELIRALFDIKLDTSSPLSSDQMYYNII